jgi:hypothetical protein
MTKNINTDIELYSRQFETTNKLVGQTISEISFYLEDSDQDFTEQPNDFGKSLLNGIDIKVSGQTFSIGNRYTSSGYGLSIDLGQTDELEFFDVEKRAVTFDTSVVGQKIKRVDIYWMTIPFEGAGGIYPQEIEIITDTGFLLISSMEINIGQANMEFTNELLVIDKIETASQLKLGEFGLVDNDRMFYPSFADLMKNGKKNGR